MKITKIKVEYSELRSIGFNNKKYGIGFEVEFPENGIYSDIRRELMEKAIRDVKLLHGDDVDGYEVEIKLVATKIKEVPF